MLSIRSLYFALLASVFFWFQYSSAYPIGNKQELLSNHNADVATCDTLDTYTTEWFLGNTLPDYRHEIHNSALFYTRGTSKAARTLAKKSRGKYVTIWEVWPCWLYDDRVEDDNPLRCIHHNPEERTVFYENMSRAFARMSRKSATVMHSFKDYEVVPQDGIWARVEMPALQEKTDVELIRKINEDVTLSSMTQITRETWMTAKLAYRNAMDEVRAIFRTAKSQSDDGASAVCNIWSSVEDEWLESLW